MDTCTPARQAGTVNGAALAELAGWQAGLRSHFPQLAGSPVAYLDSAATAQKPRAVLEAVLGYLTTANANAGRGTYPWANQTTAMLERARTRVKQFLDDPEPDRSAVHFVSGTTQGLRTVALDWLAGRLEGGDQIVVPFADHQANLVPWLELKELLACRGTAIEVVALPYDASGEYDAQALAATADPRIRFVAATHVHHVYGANMNVHRIRQAVGPDVPICLDAAQSIGHLPVSVADLDVDFVVFSGHKAMGLPGSGAVWARQARGPVLQPGGWSGSPNTTGAAGLIAALDWLDAAGLARIDRWSTALAARLTDALSRLDAYEVLGCQQSLARDSNTQHRHGIVTFRHREISSGDLGFILASRDLMVRADGHCQAPAGERDSSVRASFHVYSTVEEVDRLIQVLTDLQGRR